MSFASGTAIDGRYWQILLQKSVDGFGEQ
jgi:hypothetical protein